MFSYLYLMIEAIKNVGPDQTQLKTRSQSGQGMTEYVIVLGLIAVLLLASFSQFSRTIEDRTLEATVDILKALEVPQ